MTNYTNQTANSTQTKSKFEVRFNKNFTIAYVSKEFKEQMYDYFSEAHALYQEIRSVYPNISFRVPSSHVQATSKMTYDAMKMHLEAKLILADDDEKKELQKALDQFDTMKKLSKIQHSPYAFMVKWFKGYCPELFEKKEKTDAESAETANEVETVVE